MKDRLIDVVFLFLISTITSHPENGFNLPLANDLDVKNKWTAIGLWQHAVNVKGSFNQNFAIKDEYFIAPRSGIYHLSLYLDFNTEFTGQIIVSFFHNNINYTSKYDFSQPTSSALVNDVLLVKGENSLCALIYASSALKLTTQTRLSIQFLSTHQQFVGVIAQPKTSNLQSSISHRYITDWNLIFGLVNGFSFATGNYVVALSGVYLVICKFILVNIFEEISVSIYINNIEIHNISKTYFKKHRFDTLTITKIASLDKYSKLSIRLRSTYSEGFLSSNSSYSLVFLSNCVGKNDTLTYNWDENREFMLSKDQEVKQLTHWSHKNDTLFFNGGFHIKRTGYYYLILNIKFETFNYIDTEFYLLIDASLKVKCHKEQENRYIKAFTNGVFYLKERENINLFFKSNGNVTIINGSTITLYRIPFHVTSIYSLEIPNTSETPLLMRQINVDFNVIPNANRTFLTVHRSGLYGITLTWLKIIADSRQMINISLLHSNTNGNKWRILSSCYVKTNENCFIPLIVKLSVNDFISVSLQSSNNGKARISSNSYLEIQYLKTQELFTGLSQYFSSETTSEKAITLVIENQNEKYDDTTFFASIIRNGRQIKILSHGIYIFVCNVAVNLYTSDIRATLILKVTHSRKRQLFKYIKNVDKQNIVTIPLTGVYKFEAGDTISVTVEIKATSAIEWSVSELSRISLLLITESDDKHLLVEHNRYGSATSTGGEIWKLPMMQKSNSPYFDFFYEIKAERTFTALISISLVGKIKGNSNHPFLEASVMLKDSAIWPQLKSSVTDISLDEVSLQMTGVVTLHPSETIKIFLNLSENLQFKPLDGTLISLVVLDDQQKNVSASYFKPVDVTKGESQPEIKLDGVYMSFITISRKGDLRQKRDTISDIKMEDVEIEKLAKNVDKIWYEEPSMYNVSILFENNKSENVFVNLECSYCSLDVNSIFYAPENTQFKLDNQSNKDFHLGSSFKFLGNDKKKLFTVSPEVKILICMNTNNQKLSSSWFQYIKHKQNKFDRNNSWIYRAKEYELIFIAVNLFIEQSGRNGSAVLTVNGQSTGRETLKKVQYSKIGFQYSLNKRMYMRKDDTLQIEFMCGNHSYIVLQASQFDVLQIETFLPRIDESFPKFSIQPLPKLITKPNQYNEFTCSVVEERNMIYHWNRVDLFSSVLSSNISNGKSFKIDGLPEESGYYYCSVFDKGVEFESDLATVNISDDNECEWMKMANSSIRSCHADGSCTNTIGSYFCECNPGYYGDGYNCTDVNECRNVSICDSNSVCKNTNGSYECVCNDGFEEIRNTCVDINECELNGPNFCEGELKIRNSSCVNYPGTFQCVCHRGFQKKDGFCHDINECESDPSDYPCDQNANCENTEGSFLCKCDSGWKGNGTFCSDVDECLENTYDCIANASCQNLPGSYRCKCDRGFKGDGVNQCVPLGCFPPPFCTGQYVVSWWSRNPYIETSDNVDSAAGLLRDILTMALTDICNNCSQIKFPPPLNKSTDVEASVEKNKTDIACPLYGSKEQEKFRGFPFLPIIESPGVAFFVKEMKRKDNPLLESLGGSWPILVITLLLASLSGVIIWFLDTVHNPNEFPHSFLEGSWEGFWWAFITMTTVGYGDKAPRSFFARVFGIIWILIGLVIISTFTATITTVLTATSLSNEAKLYGTKVGALDNSEEFRLGVKRNADVKGYDSVMEIIKALKREEIQGALLDTYIAGEFQDQLQDYKLQEILEHVFVYGIVLSRDAEPLETQFRSYLERKQGRIYNAISRVVKPLKENKATLSSSSGSTGLFEADSAFFQNTMIGGSILLVALLFVGFLWDFLYWRRYARKQNIQDMMHSNGHQKPTRNIWATCDIIEYQRQSFKGEITDLKQEITSFSEEWVKRLTDIEATHEMQLDRVQRWLSKTQLHSSSTRVEKTGDGSFVTFLGRM